MSRPPRPEHHVRFNLPPPSNVPPPKSILRPVTLQNSSSGYQSSHQPSLTRRSSLPTYAQPHFQERRKRALVALKDLQSYLKEACNFQYDDQKRAISALSVASLSALIAFLNALRNDFDMAVIKRDEKLLENLNIDKEARHPALQLQPDITISNNYERYARDGHRKRMCREAEHRLLEFVSKQLDIPAPILKTLSKVQREQRELDAFKSRISKFNMPSTNAPVYTRNNSSVPNSPVDRRYTAPRSPHTDPPPSMYRAFELSHATHDDLFPQDMGDYQLPGSSFDVHSTTSTTSSSQPYLKRQQTPRHVRTSPHMAPSTSPYISPQQTYSQPSVASPYSSPYAPPATSPYVPPMSASYMLSSSSYTGSQPPSTPPRMTPQTPYVLYPGAASYPQTPPGPPLGMPLPPAGTSPYLGRAHASSAVYNHSAANAGAHGAKGAVVYPQPEQ